MYDKATHDKLTRCSFDFCEAFAREFEQANGGSIAPPPMPAAVVGSSSTAALEGAVTFTAVGDPSDGKRTYKARIPWQESMPKGATLEFPAQQPVGTKIAFKVPETAGPDAPIALKLTLQVAVDSFVLEGLRLVARTPAVTNVLPPVAQSEVDGKLAEMGWQLEKALGEGDCFFLSAMASHEILPSRALEPDAATMERVASARVASIDLIAGTQAIGGVPANMFRREEGLPVTSTACRRKLAPLRNLGEWDAADANSFVAVMFGTAVHLGRPVHVLQRSGASYLDPARTYGARNEDGTLRRTACTHKGQAETIPTWHSIPIATLLSTLQSTDTLLQFNGKDHFTPFIHASNCGTEVEANLEAPVEEVAASAEEAIADAEVARITDEEIARELATLGVQWKGASEDVLVTENAEVNIDGLHSLLDRMIDKDSEDAIVLETPTMLYEFHRSRYGQRALMSHSTPREAAEVGEEEEAAIDPPALAGKRARAPPSRLQLVSGRGQHLEQRAVLGVDGDKRSSAESHHTVKKQVVLASAPPTEQTLDAALAACRVPGVKPLSEPQSWVEATLLPDSTTAPHFHGEFIAYRWEEWGWCVGRIGAPIDADTCNFSVRYAEWTEDQVLTIEAYGVGAYGSWVQLEHDLPPIDGYQGGQYLVGGVWRRAKLMTFYSKDELARARQCAKEAVVEASQVRMLWFW